MVVAGGWGEGEVSRYYLKGIEVQFHKLQKVLEMDHGDIMGLYLMPKNCIFFIKTVNFTLCLLYCHFQK